MPRTDLAARLKQIREATSGDDRDQFSTLTGIAKSTIGNYERGDRVPDADMIVRYCAASGASADWLLNGAGEMLRKADDRLPATSSSFAYLPFYEDVEAAAGAGAAVISDAAHSVIGFARDLLRDSGASPQNCTVIRARGDSMQPTIPDGALLVVDHSQREIVNGYITVIGIADDLLVKRVRRRMDGMIDLISDNPAYAPETLGPAALQQLRVIGRVVYFCRTP